MLGAATLLHITESAVFRFLRHVHRRVGFIKCLLIHPNREMRVSFSALALIRDGGSYLLVRDLHRPEAFAPFGGVYKHKESGVLDKLEFKPQSSRQMDDMKNDLRGFLPRRNLAKLAHWFQSGRDRESAEECLQREFMEEIREAKLSKTLRCPDVLSFRFVRRVHEGPEEVPGQTYTQYRTFDVYKIDESHVSMRKFSNKLLAEARNGQENLMLATAQEIVSGRGPSSEQIGHNAGYLFGARRVRPDTPMVQDRLGTGANSEKARVEAASPPKFSAQVAHANPRRTKKTRRSS